MRQRPARAGLEPCWPSIPAAPAPTAKPSPTASGAAGASSTSPSSWAPSDALIAEGIADPQRLAIVGYSYGGYMTSWASARPPLPRAAVVGAPVTNLESFERDL